MKKNINKTLMVVTLATLGTGIAHAYEPENLTKKAIPDQFLIGIEGGTNNLYGVKIGKGGLKDMNSWSSLSASYLTTDSNIKSMNGNKLNYTSFRVGFDTTSFSSKKPFEGGVFFYKDRLEDTILDKYGLGVKLGAGTVITPQLKLSASVELSPQFLSTNWDDKIYAEYGYELSVNYLIATNSKFKISYSNHGMFLDSTTRTIYDSISLGIEKSF